MFDSNITSLSTLLQECDESNFNNSSSRNSQPPMAGSSTVVVTSNKPVTVLSSSSSSKATEKKQDIWDISEVPTEDSLAATNRDARPSPRYEICFKQSVGTEDTFLGLGDKSPSSEDCTHLVCFVWVFVESFVGGGGWILFFLFLVQM